MSLDEFDTADWVEGYRYELGRGIISVTNIPGRPHVTRYMAVRKQFVLYEAAHPDEIHTVLGGAECKVLVAGLESERHPDLAVYKKPPPDEELWSTWVPELVIEIVSRGSGERDYIEKREEYLQFGIQEYWIIDADKRQMTALRRYRGQWNERIIRAPKKYKTPLLPGLEFDCTAVFNAK